MSSYKCIVGKKNIKITNANNTKNITNDQHRNQNKHHQHQQHRHHHQIKTSYNFFFPSKNSKILQKPSSLFELILWSNYAHK